MSSETSISRPDFIKVGASGAAASVQDGMLPASGQADKPVKVYMMTDLEGVSGIYGSDLQCLPYQSPRWAESQQLLTGEVNAAVDGLIEGAATEVVVRDGHDNSRSLSALTIHPHARLLSGKPISPAGEVDSSYRAYIFVGQHAMAGAQNGILNHSFNSLGIQNMWVNNVLVG